jgi:hypothetical protein
MTNAIHSQFALISVILKKEKAEEDTHTSLA